MNAIDLLKQDHDVVDALFKRIEDTPPSKHPPIFKRIKAELDTHAHIEETIFYPVLKAKGDTELVDITMEGLEEHSQIKKFLKEIARSTSKEKREAKLKVLIEDTRHHVKEEENDMFPMVKDQIDAEELDALGDRMEIEKQKFQKRKGIAARRPVEPKGTVASLVEKAKKLVATAFTGTEPGGPAKPHRSHSAKPKAPAKSTANGKSKSDGKAPGNGQKSSAISKSSTSTAKSAGTKKSSGKSRSAAGR